ncbi:MAG: right-handed parallel beta-helix repeat-containing protein [Myxococcota bacterium]
MLRWVLAPLLLVACGGNSAMVDAAGTRDAGSGTAPDTASDTASDAASDTASDAASDTAADAAIGDVRTDAGEPVPCEGRAVSNVAELRTALAEETGDIALAPGTYVLEQPLRPPAGTSICGSDPATTILEASADWTPPTDNLPGTGIDADDETPSAYLLRPTARTSDLLFRGITLRGPTVHGAFFCFGCENVEFANVAFDTFVWSAVRTFVATGLRIHDCTFHNAGGRFSPASGGSIYNSYGSDHEFWNNRFTRDRSIEVYGIKARGGDDIRIHHNDIRVNFAIEYPFENNRNVEIDHNYMNGVVSIPKFAGGRRLADDERSFHIHHNVFLRSYSIEFPRNNVEIDHNVFLFEPTDDVGHTLTQFGSDRASGPAWMHHNLIVNPGRGVWTGPYERFSFYANRVDARDTVRDVALFKFPADLDTTSVEIRDNIIECREDNPRALFARDNDALVENNELMFIADTDRYANSPTGEVRGPGPLRFGVGIDGEIQVEDDAVRLP